jgi:TonB family protein
MAKKGEYIGVWGTLLVHTFIIALLVLVSFAMPAQEEEGGVTLMAGAVSSAYGGGNPKTLVNVDVLPKQELITQTDEEAPAIPPPVKKAEREKTEEARRLAEQKNKEKKAAEAAAMRVAGAFGKSKQQNSKVVSQGTGAAEGNATGEASEGSLSNGAGGYGTFDLSGRSIGREGLPRPQYNIQEEGKVVVTITVNPAGHVISTSINRQTNTVNPVLRRTAEEAAKKARFNEIDRATNQTGTITYYFYLR